MDLLKAATCHQQRWNANINHGPDGRELDSTNGGMQSERTLSRGSNWHANLPLIWSCHSMLSSAFFFMDDALLFQETVEMTL